MKSSYNDFIIVPYCCRVRSHVIVKVLIINELKKRGNQMELVQVYDQYKNINKTLEAFLEKYIETEETMSAQSLQEIFQDTQGGIEKLLNDAAEVQVDCEHENDLKDLKYLMTDTLFLLMDLSNFCAHNEMGRCKMRAINYLGKRKRVEVFGQ